MRQAVSSTTARSSRCAPTSSVPSTRWPCRTTCTRRASRTSPTSTDSGKSWGHRFTASSPATTATHHILDLIKSNEFGLGGFKLVESSEQGMLAQVERAVRAKRRSCSSAWAPHPMNTHFNAALPDGRRRHVRPELRRRDRQYAGAQGLSRASARTSAGCCRTCEFDVDLENECMDRILTDKVPAADLAARVGRARVRARMTPWLRRRARRSTARPALGVVQAARPGPATCRAFEDWVTAHKIPVGDTATRLRRVHQEARARLLRRYRSPADGLHAARVAALLNAVPAPLLILVIAGLAWRAAALGRPGAVRRAGAVVHHEPGLLGRDARDADAGAGRGAGRDGDRRAARHRGGATPAAATRRCGRCST